MSKNNKQMLPDEFYYICLKDDEDKCFFDERKDYNSFLDRLKTKISSFSDLYAYSLTYNQIHLLVKFHDSQRLSKVSSRYKSLNAQEMGSQNYEALYQILPKEYSKPITMLKIDGNPQRVQDIILHIHLQPVQEGFIKTMSRWEYSSYRSYITGKSDTINRDAGMRIFGGSENFLNFHRNNKGRRPSL